MAFRVVNTLVLSPAGREMGEEHLLIEGRTVAEGVVAGVSPSLEAWCLAMPLKCMHRKTAKRGCMMLYKRDSYAGSI